MKLFLKMGQPRPPFVYFRPFLNALTKIEQQTINGKDIDGVLEIRTRDSRMDGADESTEL